MTTCSDLTALLTKGLDRCVCCQLITDLEDAVFEMLKGGGDVELDKVCLPSPPFSPLSILLHVLFAAQHMKSSFVTLLPLILQVNYLVLETSGVSDPLRIIKSLDAKFGGWHG